MDSAHSLNHRVPRIPFRCVLASTVGLFMAVALLHSDDSVDCEGSCKEILFLLFNFSTRNEQALKAVAGLVSVIHSAVTNSKT